MALLSVVFHSDAFGQGRTEGYRRYFKPPFEYFYAGQDESYLEKLDLALRNITPEIETKLQTRLPDKITVTLPLTRSEFAWVTSGRVPGWAGGVAYPSDNRIVLKAPSFFGEGVPIEVLAAHEISHLLLHDAANGNYLPRWFDEGISTILAGESRSGSMGKLARAALANRLMGLPRVDDVLSFGAAEAELAYAEARSAAAAMIERFGWEGVRGLLFHVAKGTEFPLAFERATGMEYEAWQVDWIESAQRRYRNYVLIDIEDYIWILILILGAAAVVAVWVRRRRQFKQWTSEEDDEDQEKPPPVGNDPIHPE